MNPKRLFQNTFNLFLLIISMTLLTACFKCRCECVSCPGCMIVEAIDLSNDSIIATGKFCSQKNVRTDAFVQDSIRAFKSRFTEVGFRFNTRDSIQFCDTKMDVKCKDTEKLTNYECECLN